MREFSYKLSWGDLPPDPNTDLAFVSGMRMGHGGNAIDKPDPSVRKFVVDFRGGELRMRLTSSLDDAVTLYPVRPKTIPSDPSKVCADALRARAALMKEEGE